MWWTSTFDGSKDCEQSIAQYLASANALDAVGSGVVGVAVTEGMAAEAVFVGEGSVDGVAAADGARRSLMALDSFAPASDSAT